MAARPRVGVIEREVMRVTFEAEEILPVESVAARVGCSLSRVYGTYVKYGVSVPRKNGIADFKAMGVVKDPVVEAARREKIRASVKEQHRTGQKRHAVEKLHQGHLAARAAGRYDEVDFSKSEEARRKISAGLVNAYAEGRAHPLGYRGKGTLYKGIRMRSGLEAEFARQLDEAGLIWQYEPKMFRLSWCTYRPDFYLPEIDTWVECKGWMSKEAGRKVESFREETGLTLSVVWWTEVFKTNAKTHGRYEGGNS